MNDELQNKPTSFILKYPMFQAIIQFFQESSIDHILSPQGRGSIVGMFALSFAVGFAYRRALKFLPDSNSDIRVHKNINSLDRRTRAFIGLGLLIRAITTDRSLLLLFFSGFCFFEAIFSRCGFYAAIGKSSCPMD